jgi:hypothetical protein
MVSLSHLHVLLVGLLVQLLPLVANTLQDALLSLTATTRQQKTLYADLLPPDMVDTVEHFEIPHTRNCHISLS